MELTGRSQPLQGAALEGLGKEDRSMLAEERQSGWTPTGVAIFNAKHPEPVSGSSLDFGTGESSC